MCVHVRASARACACARARGGLYKQEPMADAQESTKKITTGHSMNQFFFSLSSKIIILWFLQAVASYFPLIYP